MWATGFFRSTIVLVCFAYSFGATEIFNGAEGFASDSVELGFGSRWLPNGFDPNTVVRAWGVSFNGTQPELRSYSAQHSWADQHTLLRNPAISGPSRPLILDFTPPVDRAAVFLVSLAGEERVRVKAFSPDGEALGETTRTFAPLPISELSLLATYVTLTFASTDKPISKVTVEYTEKGGAFSEDVAETMRRVVFHRTAPREFTTYIPQFVQGRLSADLIYQSEIVFLARASSTLQADVHFFDHSGQPLPLELFGDPPTSSAQWLGDERGLRITGDYDPPISGYCRISSKSPIQASLRIRSFNAAGVLLSEMESPAVPATTLAATIATCQDVIPAAGRRPNDIESALAIVNVSDKTAHVALNWRDIESTSLDIEPGEQVAAYIRELYPEFFPYPDEPTEFDMLSILTLISDQPVAIATFRTADGLPIVASPISIY